MLSNNYIATLIVKDHRKRLLEDARRIHLLKVLKQPKSKDSEHHNTLKETGIAPPLLSIRSKRKHNMPDTITTADIIESV